MSVLELKLLESDELTKCTKCQESSTFVLSRRRSVS